MHHPIGQTFARLTILEYSGINKHGKRLYKCECECGKLTETLLTYLKNGITKSCGCYGKEQRVKAIKKHGLSRKKNAEYEIWKGMKARCYNKNHVKYADYGGRGIRVSITWNRSFKRFLSDMGKRPSPRHSLDRYPNQNGNYEMVNCRWATPEQQSRNKRNNKYITFGTKTLVMEDWSKLFSVHQSTLWERLETKSIEQILVDYYNKGKITDPELLSEIETKLLEKIKTA